MQAVIQNKELETWLNLRVSYILEMQDVGFAMTVDLTTPNNLKWDYNSHQEVPFKAIWSFLNPNFWLDCVLLYHADLDGMPK